MIRYPAEGRITIRQLETEDDILEQFENQIEIKINGEVYKKKTVNPMTGSEQEVGTLKESKVKTDENGQVNPDDFFNYKL